ncbi:uncharacterized protein CBL_07783 [Carabus blaptoides fortunei]
MKFAYKFNNLLGTVHREGDLIFTSDGNSVISPVGNRITIFDLKNNKSHTLPVESRYNYTTLDLSPNGCTLIAINEEGEAHIISLVSYTIVHRYRFKRKIHAVKFSPDGKHFAVCKENNVFVFKAPGTLTGEFNSFVMERVFHAAFDETTCLDWSDDSKLLAVGSKDTNTKLYSLEKWSNFRSCSLGNHTDSIVACFFERNSFDITTISRNGQACVWECSIDPTDLVPYDPTVKRKKQKLKDASDSEDDIDTEKIIERSEEELAKALEKVALEETAVSKENRMIYKKIARHYLADEVRKDNHEAVLTAAAYHKHTKILVTGYSTGAFFIHELPDMNLIHSLSISEQKITAISLNNTGDWIALGCGGLGQLLVWEWQSETYVMKQQGHANNMTCVSYSSDGQLIASGGEDGKVKLWNVQSGFCFVTFQEHTAPVSGVTFSSNRKFVVSSSLDGTVRAYDVIRYRNFRTLTTPRPVQLSCIAVDCSGEFVAAGGQDVFEIFLWSMKFGRLLEILSGHEGPVWSLAFSPISTSTALASVSWDKTLRLWDAIEKGSAHETIELTSDGMCVVYKPDGQDVAVACLDGNIQVYNVRTASQLQSVEGRNDLGSGRSDSDLITAQKSLQAKSFTSLCYSADGQYILAGGQSKNVCIYNVQEGLIIKKFEITQNRSLDAVDDFVNRRKMTEFGNLALVEEREQTEGGNVAVKLPGAKKGDMSARSVKPELGITPTSVRETLAKQDHTNALMMAMKLNEHALIHEVIEHIPPRDVELTISSLSEKYIERLLMIIANYLETSPHIEFYLIWIQHLLTIHGPKIRPQSNLPALLALQKSLHSKYEDLSKICDFNKYTMQYISRLGEDVRNDLIKQYGPVQDHEEEEKCGENCAGHVVNLAP